MRRHELPCTAGRSALLDANTRRLISIRLHAARAIAVLDGNPLALDDSAAIGLARCRYDQEREKGQRAQQLTDSRNAP